MRRPPISHYLEPREEEIIAAALRLWARMAASPGPTPDERQWALDYADALENDTFLLETVSSPD
jgi:hypothetical protein